MASLKVETEQRSGEFRVLLFGDLDILAFEEIDQMLAGAQRNGDQRVIVDLRGLEFIDSTGIRALLLAYKRAESGGNQLCFIRGQEGIQRIFQLVGLDNRLPFCEDDDL